MPGPFCLHFYGEPANYFTYPPDVNPFPGLHTFYETFPWPQRLQGVTSNGLDLVTFRASNADGYRAYARQQGFTEADMYGESMEVMPIGRLVDLNHWGVLQACIQQCPAFRTRDDTHLAYTRGRVKRLYPCPQHTQLLEALAQALFDYAYWCHTYTEMGPVKAAVEEALQHLEYALFVMLTLRKRQIPLTDATLGELYRPSILKAYKVMRTIVKGVAREDYAKMASGDVRQFVQAGFLDLLTHEEAIDLGFATPEESWPREHAGRMRIGEHLDWLESLNEKISGAGVRHRQWREQLYTALVCGLYQAFESHGPPRYPKQAKFVAVAEILEMCGLNRGDRKAVVDQIIYALKAFPNR